MKNLTPKLTLILLTITLLINVKTGFSQVLISTGTGTPDASAMLEIKSTSGGVLIPRMTTAERELLDNGTGNPTEGLLVYDTDYQAFFIYGKDSKGAVTWYNISENAGLWSQEGSSVYLSDPTNNVGIGTSTPNKKLVIKAQNATDTLLEILDHNGLPLMIVTPSLTKFNIIKANEKNKGTAGGFAVGRYSLAKATVQDTDLFVVTHDSTRVYTGTAGGFAVGRYSLAKGSAKKAKFFFTSVDSTRVYTDGSGKKGTAGGFAVGRYSLAKGSSDIYMHMTTENYFIGHQAGLNTNPLTPGDSGKYNLFFGYQSALANTKGFRNTFVGHLTGYSNKLGRDNVFMGNKAGYNNIGGTGFDGSRNVFLGFEAGLSNTTGADNIFVGYQAGHENTTAGSNIAIGSKAGYSNTESIHNIFIGEFAGLYQKTGQNNVYMGFSSGQGPDTLIVPVGGTGENNVFIGLETGKVNTSGSSNVYIGNQSGWKNTTGLNNVFLGEKSGYENLSGANNVAIGTLAGFQTVDGLNNVFLGNNAGYSNDGGNSNVFMGNNAGFSIANSAHNVFIGDAAGSDAIVGDNNIFIGDSAGVFHKSGNDNVYLGNKAGSGIVTFTNPNHRNVVLGANAGSFMDDAIDNVFIGHKAGEGSLAASVTGDFNVVIGEQAGNHLSSGNRNVFIGNEAGNNTNTGGENVFMGYRCGFNNQTGNKNVFIGPYAGESNTTGSSNMFLGPQAGQSNSTGSTNMFIGPSAGQASNGDYNMAIGVGSGSGLTSGSHNLFIGQVTGNRITTGSGNILIGELVGYHSNFDPASSDNVLIGNNAAYYLKKGKYNTLIGNNAGSGDSYLNDTLGSYNTLVGKAAGYNMIGDNNTAYGYHAGQGTIGNGNVYIGYDVQGHGTENNKLYIDNSNTAAPLIYGDFTDGSELVRINGDLNINNAYTFPSADGAANDVMKTDGSGNVSWVPVSSLDATTASNGLTLSGNDVQLGGTLTKSTWVNLGSNLMGYNLTGTGNFYIYNGSKYAFTVTDDGQSGNVGIGTSSPAANTTLHVVETAGTTPSISAGTVGLFQQNSGSGNWASVAIISGTTGRSTLDFGDADDQNAGSINYSNSDNSMLFITNAGEKMRIESGGDVGIGTTNPGYRLHVVDNTASNDDAAIYGIHQVTNNYGTGVRGVGGFYGVYGIASGGTSGTRYGIYGTASGGTTNWAGYFNGNVNVTGTLSKGGGSFKIDHPLDPENKYLYHSFVESPDMMNIYNGNVILDEKGEAVVTMPDWFEALNMKFRYQLTAIGAPGPNLYIAEEIKNHTFKIAGGTAGMKVSWQVTGIRHDPFANKNRIPVEVDKKSDEKGKYLYPDAYNQPKEKGIDYNNQNK